ncbi:MAG: DotU family type IV/VI secretion system protein, partial [Planctomycetota bacterium]|nr:DotU family type IV/VI secretion system protein [Planctomycetota bacterium]
AEACDPLFVLVLELQQLADPGPGDVLRARLNAQLTATTAAARALGASEGALQDLRYAFVALVDEVVLGSSWPLKAEWQGRPLQLEHFNSFAAGEEFFRRLEAVRAGADPHRVELLSIFATCLCLGFRGKHVGVQGMEVVRGLQRALIDEVKAASEQTTRQAVAAGGSASDVAAGRSRRRSEPGELSPAWRPPSEPLLARRSRDLPVRLVAVASAALTLLVFVALAAALRHGTSAVLTTVGQ